MSQIIESIDVDVPVTTAYNQWTQFEQFPQVDGIFGRNRGAVILAADSADHLVFLGLLNNLII